jgi:hypothetical protein
MGELAGLNVALRNANSDVERYRIAFEVLLGYVGGKQ